MNKPLIAAGLAVLIIVAGGGIYIATKDKDNANNVTTQSTSQNTQTTAKTSTSIKGLLAQNKNLKCTFNATEPDGSKSSGTAYIAGQRMRGNFRVQPAGEAEQKGNLLRDDSYQYIWSDDSKTGLKIANSSTESTSSEQQSEQNNQTIDQDKNYDFECSEWTVDESQFTVPTDVTFTDYSAQIKQSQEAQQNMSGACAQITNPTARAACESAL